MTTLEYALLALVIIMFLANKNEYFTWKRLGAQTTCEPEDIGLTEYDHNDTDKLFDNIQNDTLYRMEAPQPDYSKYLVSCGVSDDRRVVGAATGRIGRIGAIWPAYDHDANRTRFDNVIIEYPRQIYAGAQGTSVIGKYVYKGV